MTGAFWCSGLSSMLPDKTHRRCLGVCRTVCRTDRHELYVVLERVSETLVAASEMMHRFNTDVLGESFQGD